MTCCQPKPKCTVGYRRFVLEKCDGTFVVTMLRQSKFASSDAEGVQTSRDFIKWIDTEWQYHELKENTP